MDFGYLKILLTFTSITVAAGIEEPLIFGCAHRFTKDLAGRERRNTRKYAMFPNTCLWNLELIHLSYPKEKTKAWLPKALAEAIDSIPLEDNS